MAISLGNRAKMSTSTTGTGTITLGSASSGYQSFDAAGITNSQTVRYAIEDGTAFEIGSGTYTSSGTTLTRSVTESSNSDNAITLSGNAEVFITAAVADLFINDGASNLTTTGVGTFASLDISGNIDVDGTTNLDAVDIDGAVDIASTLTVTGTTDVGTLEFNSLSGTGAVAITDILDEDNMASNSATKISTQQSIKAYVDSQVATVDTLTEVLANGNTTATDQKIQFRDNAIYINSSADGQLDIVADTEVQIAATTIDINGAIALNGAITGATNITLSGELDAGSLDISGNADIDGTLEADEITVNGTALATVIAGTTVTNATNSSHVLVTDNESTNEENLISFVEGATSSTGNVGLEMDGNFTYNPSTGTVTATIFKGNIDAVNGDFDGTLEADAITLDGTAVTATATLDTGISNNNVPKFTSGVADDDFLRVAGTAIEGRSASEVLSDIGGQASLTFGISNTNAVKIDSSSVADDEYARFTANGLESRATSEVLSDIGAAPAAGSSNIVTTGALNSGSITSGFGAINNGSSAITTTGVITGGTLEATTDTAAGDNAAIGYTSAEGLILTGQGSTNDVTIKNDADAIAMRIPTGTTGVTFASTIAVDNVDIATGAISLKNSGSQSYIRFYCESSNAHYAQLQAPAHSAFSGNITLTLPATTDTVAGIAATQTFTNKTLTAPKINEDVAVTTTATEINLIDGGTSRGTTAVASGDGILINDAGTMRMTNVDTVSTYFSSHSVGGGNIVTTGALNSGSITSGFGAIDNGSSSITTTGVGSFGSLDISGAIDVDGTTNLDVVDIDGAVNMATTLLVTGVSTFTAKPIVNAGISVKNGATGAGFVEFFEDSDNGTNKVTLIGPASTADITLTLPNVAGTVATTDDATALAIALG